MPLSIAVPGACPLRRQTGRTTGDEAPNRPSLCVPHEAARDLRSRQAGFDSNIGACTFRSAAPNGTCSHTRRAAGRLDKDWRFRPTRFSFLPCRRGETVLTDSEHGVLRLAPMTRTGPASPARLPVYPLRDGECVGMAWSGGDEIFYRGVRSRHEDLRKGEEDQRVGGFLVSAFRWFTPLCPAGHLPLKEGDHRVANAPT